MNVKVKMYDDVKYSKFSRVAHEVVYHDIRKYEVVCGDIATLIGFETDENSRDRYNEYLIITLNNGETATFCNSNVDLFQI